MQEADKVGSEEFAETINVEIQYLEFDCYEEGQWWWYIFALPLMKLMEWWVVSKETVVNLFGFKPDRTSILFDRNDTLTKTLIENSTEWVALDCQYELAGESFKSFWYSNKTKDCLDAVWMKYMLHNQAVRNRFRIVKSLLRENIGQIASSMKRIRIVGLASGSGRDMIDVLANLSLNDTDIQAYLIDHNRNAIEKARQLSEQKGVSDQVQCMREVIRSGNPPTLTIGGDAMRLSNAVRKLRPDIVYNIGFFDYIPNKLVVRMKSEIRSGLGNDGVLISGNIIPNWEMGFLPRIINWAPMYHRTPEEFRSLLMKSGFSSGRIYVEPNHIFAIGEWRINTQPQ